MPSRDHQLKPDFDEHEAVRLFERVFSAAKNAELELGIGDDAAILRVGRERLVFTVDTSVEGVHFDRRWLSLEDVGWRALQAAASDVSAMGGRPIAALSNLILPARIRRRELEALARGQAAAARALRCPIVGGNLSRGKELSVTTSVLGLARRPIRRSGARPGDSIVLLGDVGLARAGLSILKRGLGRKNQRALRVCIDAWRRPRALSSLAPGARAHAAIDVSDGLSLDLRRLAEASGVHAVIEERALRRALRPELRRAAERLGEDPLELALSGGEDYALIVALPRGVRLAAARRIGRIERGSGALLEHSDGQSSRLGEGYEHF